MDSIFTVAELVLTIILIIGALIGWLKTWRADIEHHAKQTADIAALKETVDGIKTTIGNGAGIRRDIEEIKLNCATEMSSMKERVKHLEEGKHE